MVTTTLRRPLTADEYQQMAEKGILNEDERIELIDGEMIFEDESGVCHRPLFADEFQQMAEKGMNEDERIELLGGEMYHMAAIGVRHVNAVRALNHILNRQVGTIAIVDVQNPIRLDDRSMPLPDLLVLQDREYPDIPRPADIFILIEVGDSSYDSDRGTKMPRYAAAGVLEAWLVNLNANTIERYSDPRDGRYHQVIIAEAADILSSTVLPDLAIPVAAVLGPTDQR